MGVGYAYDNISVEELLNDLRNMERITLADYGHVYTISEFTKMVYSKELTDAIGDGALMLDGKVLKETESWLFLQCFYINEKYILTLDALNEIFGDKLKVFWANHTDIL